MKVLKDWHVKEMTSNNNLELESMPRVEKNERGISQNMLEHVTGARAIIKVKDHQHRWLAGG